MNLHEESVYSLVHLPLRLSHANCACSTTTLCITGARHQAASASRRSRKGDDSGSSSSGESEDEEDTDLCEYCRVLHSAYAVGHICELLSTLRWVVCAQQLTS